MAKTSNSKQINPNITVKDSKGEDQTFQVRIVIAQRGWVFIGFHRREGVDIVLRGAKVIRQWGTKQGLGELRNGKLTETILDQAGLVRLHPLQIIATIDADAESWLRDLEDIKLTVEEA